MSGLSHAAAAGKARMVDVSENPNTRRIAGVMAAKRTGELIPRYRPIALTEVDITFAVQDDRVEIHAMAAAAGKTGVEMEALAAASVAALTSCDRAKALERTMEIRVTWFTRRAGSAASTNGRCAADRACRRVADERPLLARGSGGPLRKAHSVVAVAG